jgi:hypothetical protein
MRILIVIAIALGIGLSSAASGVYAQEAVSTQPQPPAPASASSSPDANPADGKLLNFTAELRLRVGTKTEIFLRLPETKIFGEGLRTYYFPVSAGLEYPPDIKGVGEAVVGTKEIVLLREGILFRGNYRNWQLMVSVIIDKINQNLERGMHAVLVGEPLNCTLKGVTCPELIFPATQMATKGGQ